MLSDSRKYCRMWESYAKKGLLFTEKRETRQQNPDSSSISCQTSHESSYEKFNTPPNQAYSKGGLQSLRMTPNSDMQTATQSSLLHTVLKRHLLSCRFRQFLSQFLNLSCPRCLQPPSSPGAQQIRFVALTVIVL